MSTPSRMHLPHTSLLALSSCTFFLLSIIAGKFGMSDADVLMQFDDRTTLTAHPSGSSNNSTSISPAVPSKLALSPSKALNSATTSFSLPSIKTKIIRVSSPTTATTSTPVDSTKYQKNLQHNLLSHHSSSSSVSSKTRKSTTNNKNNNVFVKTPSSSFPARVQEQKQLYFRFMDFYSARRKFSKHSGFQKRSLRNANSQSHLGKTRDKSTDGSYPVQLTNDDNWVFNRDRLLNRLVIQVLSNLEEWTALRRTFDKVDRELKALLFLKNRGNQTVSKTSNNSNTDNHEHHNFTKFIYHRVPELNRAGQPTTRGITAVVSVNSSTDAESESKNETVMNAANRNSDHSNPKTFPRQTISSHNLVQTHNHTIPKAGDTATSKTESSSSYHNFYFSRFGSKRKQVDLASDKNSANSGESSGASDNSKRKSSHSASDNNNNFQSPKTTSSVLVLSPPKETVLNQEGTPNSHKIRWDSSPHRQDSRPDGNRKTEQRQRDEVLLPPSSTSKRQKQLVLVPPLDIVDETTLFDDNNKSTHNKRHHFRRHHNHRHRADHNFLPNYYHFSHHHNHKTHSHHVQHP